MKTYEEAKEESFKVKWKVAFCTQGEDCWCRGITTEIPIINDQDDEYYIASTGTLSKEVAEYLVELHNKNLY